MRLRTVKNAISQKRARLDTARFDTYTLPFALEGSFLSHQDYQRANH
jgi:hypothetical protein